MSVDLVLVDVLQRHHVDLDRSPAAWPRRCRRAPCRRSPQRVMARNLSGSRVSSETFTRRTPAADSSPAKRASWLPLVVSVSSSSAPLARCRDRLSTAHDVAPDQRLAAGQPQLAHAAGDEGRAQPVEFLQRQNLLLGQERHVLGHAVDAAEVAAVGDRDAQVGDFAAERVDAGQAAGQAMARAGKRRPSLASPAVKPYGASAHGHGGPTTQGIEVDGPAA
jgi:hypothetical protein